MRLDHIAYRVADRKKTAQFFIDAFGYRVQDQFEIKFDDGSTARCLALEPPEKLASATTPLPWTHLSHLPDGVKQEFHMPPEIFVSDGEPGSVVFEWVKHRDGVGGIHHLAYQVPSVKAKMKEWKDRGYAEFTTQDVLTCPDLVQVFTKPSSLTGVIYEFIERGAHGFCRDNVKNLMDSTRGLS